MARGSEVNTASVDHVSKGLFNACSTLHATRRSGLDDETLSDPLYLTLS